jgi:hypothetical protein
VIRRSDKVKVQDLSGIKKIADIYAKVPLKPHNISICSMHDLIKLNAITNMKKPDTMKQEKRTSIPDLSLGRILENFPKIWANMYSKF